jgi:type IV pilus assembly protein PilZ
VSTPKLSGTIDELERLAAAGRDERPADRRAHERIAVDIEVDYRTEDTFLFAYITDISAMGIFIRTNTPEAPGTLLTLRFSPPLGPPIELDGEVIWINPYRPGDYDESRFPGMGVRFVNLDDTVRLQVLELVKTFAVLAEPDEADETLV